MRQAGRYLPEYREIRKKVKGFMALCKSPELACEVTLQPLARFDLDAAILFSDILTIPDAMGLGLSFEEGKGPVFSKPVQHLKAVQDLPTLDVDESLGYVFEAARQVKTSLNGKVPLIGFAGSPWTVATYMVEGGPSKTFNIIKKMMYQTPEVLHLLLKKLAETTLAYAKGQIKAGAEVFMLFDTWGGILDDVNYINFSLNYLKLIVQGLKSDPACKAVPVILFSKNGGRNLVLQAQTGCDGLGLDWVADMKVARETVGHEVALQGNLDPAVLYASPHIIEEKVQHVLSAYGSGTGHVFNLGHGIYPDIPIDHVESLVEAVKKYSPQYHQNNQEAVVS